MRKLYKELICIKQQEKISDRSMMLRMVMMIMIILASLATMSMSAYAFFTYNISSEANTITAANFEVEITIEEKGIVLPEGEELTIKSVSTGDALEMAVPSVTQEQAAEQTTEQATEQVTESAVQEEETLIKSVSPGDALEAIEVQDAVKDTTAANPISEQTLKANLTEMAVRPVTEEELVELTVLSTNIGICANKYSLSVTGGNVYTITLKPSDNSTAKTGFVVITAENCDNRYHTQQIDVSDGNTAPLTFVIKPNGDTMVTFTAHWGTSSYYDNYKTEGDNEDLYITQDEEIMLFINGAEEQRKVDLTIPAKDGKGSTEETMESK